MPKSTVRYLILLLSSGVALAGCGRHDKYGFPRISVRDCNQIQFDKVAKDFNGTMFDVVEVQIGGRRVDLLGFEPDFESAVLLLDHPSPYTQTCAPVGKTLLLLQRSSSDDQKYEPVGEMVVGLVGARRCSYLYILFTKDQVMVAEAVKDVGNVMFRPMRADNALALVEDSGLSVKPGDLLVEERFYDFLQKRGVKVPDNAVRVPAQFVEKDS